MNSAARTWFQGLGVLAGAAVILGLPIAFFGPFGGLAVAAILIAILVFHR